MGPTIDEISKILDIATGISHSDRKSWHWLSRQNELLFMAVFQAKKSHFYRIKAQGTVQDLVMIDLIAFILAIKEIMDESSLPKRKNRSVDLSKLRKIGAIRAKQFRKVRSNTKREKLLNLHGVIMNLIEIEKYSYRDVAQYLKTYHRFSISHTAVRSFYCSMTGITDEANTYTH